MASHLTGRLECLADLHQAVHRTLLFPHHALRLYHLESRPLCHLESHPLCHLENHRLHIHLSLLLHARLHGRPDLHLDHHGIPLCLYHHRLEVRWTWFEWLSEASGLEE
jgi:hypothetical protein